MSVIKKVKLTPSFLKGQHKIIISINSLIKSAQFSRIFLKSLTKPEKNNHKLNLSFPILILKINNCPN